MNAPISLVQASRFAAAQSRYDDLLPDDFQGFTGTLSADMTLGNGDKPVHVTQVYEDGEVQAEHSRVMCEGADVTDMLVDAQWDAVDAFFDENWTALLRTAEGERQECRFSPDDCFRRSGVM